MLVVAVFIIFLDALVNTLYVLIFTMMTLRFKHCGIGSSPLLWGCYTTGPLLSSCPHKTRGLLLHSRWHDSELRASAVSFCPDYLCLHFSILFYSTSSLLHMISSFNSFFLLFLLSGGYENFVKARRQYTISLNMQQPDRNLRALYGLLSASRAVEEIAAAGQWVF